jgi:Na+/H+ antiporter NhaC
MRKLLPLLFFYLLLFSGYVFPSNQNDIYNGKSNFNATNIRIEIPDIIVRKITYEIKIHVSPEAQQYLNDKNELFFVLNNQLVKAEVINGVAKYPHAFNADEAIEIRVEQYFYSKDVRPIPLWLSIFPPLIAILMALLLKEVFTALFTGLLVGTSIISFYQESNFIIAIGKGLLRIIDTYILESLFHTEHLSIIVFSLLIGGMVSIIIKNGGMNGIVNLLSKKAASVRSGQFITWLLGVVIFFDDYANTLVVGNTMRPVTDKLKISREKLSYIVDSTAAPVASIAFVTTWIGAELSYIQDGIITLGLDETAYNIFLHSLRFSYYPILALCFILLLIFMRKDFGPMYFAEKRARGLDVETSKKEKKEKISLVAEDEMQVSKHIVPRWYNGAIPVLIIVFGTLLGLMVTGWDEQVWNDPDRAFSTKLSAIIGNSNSFKALLWSSLSGVIVAIVLSTSQRLLTLKEATTTLINGFKTMLTAVVILVMAWAIAMITKDLHTADYISQILVKTQLPAYFVPAITFILAALIAFSTGSSWGTMAILYPLILPASWLICQSHGMNQDASLLIFYNTVSTVLAGSVLGDHCSPISDTTILSSLASSCNHIEHVRTQLPYAITVGAVAVIFGTLPAAFGIPSYILFPVGIILLYLIIRYFGKKVD